MVRLLLPLFVLALLVGCDTSSHDVVLSEPVEDADPNSLSVQWAAMQERMDRLEVELASARAETRTLCTEGSVQHPICQAITSQDQRVAMLSSALDVVDDRLDATEERVVDVEATVAPMSYDARSKTVSFTGVNLQIRNGQGATGANDGTGNLIVGWNERDDNDVRTGSHNVIVGSFHAYEGHAGLAVGIDHALLADGAAIVGGEANTAVADGGTLVGGQDNSAFGEGAVVVGGWEQVVQAAYAVLLSTELGNDEELRPDQAQE